MNLKLDNENFHPIDFKMLDKKSDLVFNIFYKTQDNRADHYILYASKEPRYRDRVRELLQSPDFDEQLFIHEDDLNLYFEHATNSLRDFVINSDVTPEKKWNWSMTFPVMSPVSFLRPILPPKFSVVLTRLWI